MPSAASKKTNTITRVIPTKVRNNSLTCKSESDIRTEGDQETR